ncbi:glycosyltransferase family 2 protein [Rhodoplanes roseus]|nr:glycosyltransferase family 2 protein [Rhodoplanes roseus]
MSAATRPQVSVVLPVYNAVDSLGRAVDSVLEQTVGDLELIVVDDGSTDGTPSLVADAYGREPRVRMVRLPRNRGPAHARNVALAAASGTWIGLVDADDAWRRDRLARLLAHAEGADAVFDNLLERDPVTGEVAGPLFPSLPSGPLTIEGLLAPTAPGSRYNYGYLKPLVRREFLRARTIAYDESLRTSEDLLLYLVLLLEGAVTRMVDEALYVYTVPVSRTGSPSAASNTVPRDDEVRAALADVSARYSDRIGGAAVHALSQRIAFLERIRPVSEFDHARRRREYRRATALFVAHAAVRREVVLRLRSRLSRRSRRS